MAHATGERGGGAGQRWLYWTATTLTVKTFDGRAPDTALWAFPSSASKWMMRINGAAVTACVENIDFVGGTARGHQRWAPPRSTTFSYSEFHAFHGRSLHRGAALAVPRDRRERARGGGAGRLRIFRSAG